MGRIVVKGGVWKNTEDEILKAAVMKYGMNQWSRISSLLVRKSAKQCKARWYEWLDPSIRKTEWKREEEEKLLHLAKIMPCQWRTIAPMMGRTAAQLLEKYEQLLDAAQQPEAVAAAAAASSSSSGAAAAGAAPLNARDRLKMDDPRRLRPGEIDPLPEAKPARPDPIDMDEDEKEMLSEARARLANTKGKKAKRKAREKQLEEARRLAVLQKQREMKAAGLEQRVNRKRKAEIDYNEEVPLEKKLPGGFYSTAEEDAEHAAKVHQEGFKRIGLQELEGKSRQATEMDERKKDAKRLKLLKETNLPEALLKINQLNDPLQISRRLEMNLPTPQVSDSELSEIAKMTGGNLGAALAGGATPMRAVGGQTPLIRPGAGITARTPMRPDNILRESQNILSIQNTSSSLLGGENTPLHDSDFGGIKPKTSVIATPNALATPMHASAGAGGATPLRQAVPGTPLRDSLGVNAHAPAATSSAAGLSAQQAISASRARAENRRTANKVASSLASLPAPQNQFALVLPDLPKEADNDVEMVEEDAEEAALKAAVRSVEKKEAEWRAESQVIQRGLPRPLVVNLAANIDASDPVQAEIQKELLNLVKYDVAKFPVENQAADKKKQQSKRAKIPSITRYSETELSSARSLVEQELEASLGRKLSAEDLKELLTSLDLSSWDAHMSDELFVPSAKNFGIASTLPKGQLLEALQQQFELIKSSVQAQSKKASKLEQNLNVTIGGYQSINTKIRTEISQLYVQLVEATRNHSCFEMLASMETSAIPARQHQVHQLYAQQQEKEKEMQKRFQLLSQQVAELK